MAAARLAAAALVALFTLTSCAGLALSSGTQLERAAATVHSQLRTVVLVTEAGARPGAATTALSVVLDDAESALSDQESVVAARPRTEPHRDDVLAVTRDARRLVGAVGDALGDRAALDRARQRLTALADRLERWGLA